MAIFSLTYQLSFLRWEKHVDVVGVDGGWEVLITVGYCGAPRLELPSVDLERGSVRVGGDGSNFPGDVAFVGAWVGSEPMKRASILRTLEVWGLESKTKSDGWPGRLTTENSANKAHVEIICGPARRQTK